MEALIRPRNGQDGVSLLLVEDSASEARRVRELLLGLSDPPTRVELASTLAGAIGALRKHSFDVVILDLALPDGCGLAALRRVRAAGPASAVIVRTTQREEQLGPDAVAAGAHDYLLKDGLGTPETVERSIRVALARRRAEEAARELATVLTSSDEAIIGLAPDGTISSWNPAAEHMYGYAATEALGREILFLAASAGEAGRLRRSLERISRGQSVGTLGCRHRRADNSELAVALKMAATAGPGDQPTAVIVMVRDVSEERRAVSERNRILSRLRETQRIARLGLWSLDTRNGELRWWAEMEPLFERDPATGPLTVEAWLACVDEPERARVAQLLAGGKGGDEFSFECHRGSGPEQRTIHVIGQVDPDDPVMLLGTAQDVTELRATERALRSSRAEQMEQRELLSAVLENAPIGLAIVQVSDNHPARVNQALGQILGYTGDELRATDLLDITHPEDRPRLKAAMRRLLDGEVETYQTEIRYFHREGQVIWAELSASLIREDGGEPRYFVVQVSDISNRKRVERALQQERDHTAAILAAIGEGYALSVDGRITEVNDALCSLTGYSREELVGAGQPWPFWPRPSGLWSPDLTGAPPEQEIVAQMIRRDGSRFEAEVNARAAHNPDGSVLGWVIAIRDVSDRRRYEAELERMATHDPLTGLANHRLFHQRLSEEVAMARRYGRSLSVAILDLDHFKEINDAHGHLVGDQTLKTVAHRLAEMVREGELLARVGGEEFAWILPEADEEGARMAAERGRAAVSSAELPPAGRITISVGVANLEEGLDASGLYDRADHALLTAKREGRDRTVRWAKTRVVG